MVAVNVRIGTRRDDEAWVGWCPSLQVASTGTTRRRAAAAAREAVVLWLETCSSKGTLHEALEDVGFVQLSPDDAVRNALDKPVERNGRSYDFVEVNRVQYLREVDYMHGADDSLNGGESASEFSYQVLPATA
jgi:predicted RNase H-like HicB family nuclease